MSDTFIFSFQLKRVLFFTFFIFQIFLKLSHIYLLIISQILRCLKSNYAFSCSEIWANPQRQKSILKWYETANKMTLSSFLSDTVVFSSFQSLTLWRCFIVASVTQTGVRGIILLALQWSASAVFRPMPQFRTFSISHWKS